MTVRSKSYWQSLLLTGYVPTQANFADLVDSYANHDVVKPFSVLDYFLLNGTVPVSTAGNFTTGTQFRPVRQIRILGVRVYWNSAGNQTLTVKLWNQTDAAAVASQTIVTSGVGFYSGIFASPYDVPANRVNEQFFATMRDNAGATYMVAQNTSPKAGGDPPITYSPPGFYFLSMAAWVAGDAKPNALAAANRYTAEPIIDPDT